MTGLAARCVTAAILACTAACSRSPDPITVIPSVNSPAEPITIPLKKYQGRLRSMRVNVAGDSLDFLFDTGGGWTLVSPGVAGRTQCSPAGRSVGYRMTGERIEVSVCARPLNFRIAGWVTDVVEAGVFDLMSLLPRDWPPLHGVLSLKTFAGQAITLDLARDRMIIESPRSLAQRTSGMTPLQTRIATGDDGSALVLFVAVPAAGANLWLEFDSGNLDNVLLSPHSARALQLPAGDEASDIRLALGGADTVTVTARRRELIFDGALNAAFIETRVFTIDLANGRAWIQKAAR